MAIQSYNFTDIMIPCDRVTQYYHGVVATQQNSPRPPAILKVAGQGSNKCDHNP